jgi:hypothetical protein
MTIGAGVISGAVALTLIAAFGGAATAQVTADQQSAIRNSCRSDFSSKCAGVTPGGKDALACLQKNVASLAPACKTAVSATISAPAPAAAKRARAAPAPAPAAAMPPAEAPAGPTEQQMSAVKFTCRSDFRAYCHGVPQGGPEALACLQNNSAKLDPDCKTSLEDIGDALPAAAAAPSAAAPAAVQAAHPRPPGITPAGRVMRRAIERNQ